MDIWEMIATERRSTADMLEGLTAEQWSQPSLCGDWTVKEVAAHLTIGWNVSLPAFMVGVAKHRGFNPANAVLGTELAAQRSPAQIIADLRANANHHFKPPGVGPQAPLTDVVLHTQDIAVPLGIDHPVPPAHARPVLELLTGRRARSFNPPGGIAGLRFEATDQDWFCGDGPVVRGPSGSLALSLGGRVAGVDALAGPGVEEYRARFGASSRGTSPRKRFYSELGRQLSHPEGRTGRIVGELLNRRNKGLYTRVLGLMEIRPGEHVADVGFGGGVGLRSMLDAVGPMGRVTGVEISWEMLARAARRYAEEITAERLVLHHGSVDSLPFDSETVDGIASVNTVYFWPDVSAAAAELFQVLRPGGRLVLGVADPETLQSLPFTGERFRLLTLEDLARSLVDAGFDQPEVNSLDLERGAYHCVRADRPLSL